MRVPHLQGRKSRAEAQSFYGFCHLLILYFRRSDDIEVDSFLS